MPFKDYFSKQSKVYSLYRPTYPRSLFDYLASISVQHEKAWDCATGNGQAAISLSSYFHTVIATDPSPAQIEQAPQNPNVIYQIARAEKTEISSYSVDLITVAQALHWFNLKDFYQEVGRVLKPEGILAIWGSEVLDISPSINEILRHFYSKIVGEYWPPEIRILESGYRSIPFPFQEIASPEFKMEAAWSMNHLLGYLESWSATQKYREVNQINPIGQIRDDLAKAWGIPEEPKRVIWPIRMRIGKLI